MGKGKHFKEKEQKTKEEIDYEEISVKDENSNVPNVIELPEFLKKFEEEKNKDEELINKTKIEEIIEDDNLEFEIKDNYNEEEVLDIPNNNANTMVEADNNMYLVKVDTKKRKRRKEQKNIKNLIKRILIKLKIIKRPIPKLLTGEVDLNKQKEIVIENRKKRKKRKRNKKIIKFFVFILIVLIVRHIIIHKDDIKMTENEEVEGYKLDTKSVIFDNLEEDKKIEELITNYRNEKGLTENNFAFFYCNVDEQKSYFYNENKYFTAGSTIKVPIAIWYYDAINDNKRSLDDTLTYTRQDYAEGVGVIANKYSFGDEITIEELLKESIVNSDNTAINILINEIERDKYREEISKYSEEELIEDFYESNIINAKYGYDIMKHIYINSDKYKDLIENMKKSSEGKYLKEYIDNYDVAHKYGSYDGNIHDYGIVYGNETYLIGVYTKGVSNADKVIADINLKVLEYLEK